MHFGGKFSSVFHMTRCTGNILYDAPLTPFFMLALQKNVIRCCNNYPSTFNRFLVSLQKILFFLIFKWLLKDVD